MKQKGRFNVKKSKQMFYVCKYILIHEIEVKERNFVC